MKTPAETLAEAVLDELRCHFAVISGQPVKVTRKFERYGRMATCHISFEYGKFIYKVKISNNLANKTYCTLELRHAQHGRLFGSRNSTIWVKSIEVAHNTDSIMLMILEIIELNEEYCVDINRALGLPVNN